MAQVPSASRAAMPRSTGERPLRGTVHSGWPAAPQRRSSELAARNPVVAARSMSATGRSVRTRSPAIVRAGWGVVTAGRER